ncbi:MAG: MDR family MFS transporter [Methanomassiliicoccales archaeon]
MGISEAVSHYKEFDRRIWVLFFSQLTVATGFSVVLPFLAIYFHEGMGVPMSLVGTVFLVGASMVALGSVIGGEVSDRVGRRKVMLLAIGSRAVAFTLVALVIMTDPNFLAISALVVVSWLVGSLYEPAANAMIADVVEPGKRMETFGFLRVGANIGWGLGPMLGGFLAAASYSSLFLLTAVTCAISAVMVALWINESIGGTSVKARFTLSDLASVRKDRVFTLFCLTSLVLFLAISQMSSTFSVFAKGTVGLAEVQIGYLYSINGGMVALLQIPAARAMSRFRITRMLILGALVYAGGYFLVGFAEGFALLAMCMITITAAEIMVSPSSMNLVANLSPDESRGRYMGVFTFFTASGWAAGPFIGGLLIDGLVGLPVLLWGLVACFGILGAMGYTLLGRRMPWQVNRSLAELADGNG